MSIRASCRDIQAIVKSRTGINVTIGLVTKLLHRWTADIVIEAAESVPYATDNPVGWMVVYCDNRAKPQQKKMNKKLMLPKFTLKSGGEINKLSENISE